MAGTNAAVVKKALHGRIEAALAALPDMASVQVLYGPPREIDAECVYLGRATWTHTHAGLGDREERLIIAVHGYVRRKGAAVEETDARVVELGAVIEGLFDDDPNMAGTPGVMWAGVEEGELDGGPDDDAALSVLEFRLRFTSVLET